MKKLITLGAIALMLMFLVGAACDDDPEEDLVAPTNLTYSVASEGTAIVLSWNPSSTPDVTYSVYLGARLLASDITGTSYTHTFDELGRYDVVAVREGEESDPISFSTATVSGTSDYVYAITDPSPTNPSGFGWNTDGTGQSISVSTGDRSKIDMILGDDGGIYYLDSPDLHIGDGNVTYFRTGGVVYGDFVQPLLPGDAGYGDAAETHVNNAFYVALERGARVNYAKVQIVERSGNSVKFRWEYQRINGLRGL